jgi:hypothetical protein
MRHRTQLLLLSIMVTTAFLSLGPWAASSAQAAARDDGRREQVFLNSQVRLVYHPQDFRVGGEAVITVENAQPAKIELNIEQSNFADEGLGLKAEHIAFDPDLGELQVKLPDTLPSREFKYLLAFKCEDEYELNCARPGRAFSLPVFNDQEPILRIDVKAPLVIRMGQDSTVAYVNLISTNRFYHPSHVRVVPDPSFKDLGISALGIAGYQDWKWVEESIAQIHAGSRWVGLIRADRAGFWKVLWGYVAWDWERKARDVPVTLHYQDQYDRDWPPVPATVRIEYEMPMNLAILYYMGVLLVCTVLGNAMRWFVGKADPSWSSEVRAWLYSWALAGLFCVVGFLIQLKVEPFGAFEVGFANIRGIVMTGLLAGLMPDEIKARIQGLIPGLKGKDQLPAAAGERRAA